MDDYDLAAPSDAGRSPYDLVDEARCAVLRQAELMRSEIERLVDRSRDIFTFDPDEVTSDVGQIERSLSCIRAALAVFAPASDR
jgi:hypothetical protein